MQLVLVSQVRRSQLDLLLQDGLRSHLLEVQAKAAKQLADKGKGEALLRLP